MAKVQSYQTPHNEYCLQRMQAERAFRASLATALERQKITVMEWLLLGVVGRSDERRTRMSAAAEALGVTLPQVTALASHLLELKLVRQKVSSSDKRGRQLELTGKGMNVLEDAEETVGIVMQQGGRAHESLAAEGAVRPGHASPHEQDEEAAGGGPTAAIRPDE